MGKKRTKRGSSSNEDGMEFDVDGDCYQELKDSIDVLKKLLTEGLAEIHSHQEM